MPRRIEVSLTLDGVRDGVTDASVRHTLAQVLGGALRVHSPKIEATVDGQPVDVDPEPYYDRFIAMAAIEFLEVQEKNQNSLRQYAKLRWMWRAKLNGWNPNDYGIIGDHNPAT